MRKKEGNKERDILEAAIKIFAERGYHKAKISIIAEVAGVATGSVYLYYLNKEEILNQIFRDLWKQMAAQLEPLADRQDLNAEKKLDGMIDMVFESFLHKPELAIVFVNEHNHLMLHHAHVFQEDYDRFLAAGRKIVKDGMENGSFSKDIDLDVLRLFVFGGIRHLLHQWAQSPDKLPLENIRLHVKRIIKDGILRTSQS